MVGNGYAQVDLSHLPPPKPLNVHEEEDQEEANEQPPENAEKQPQHHEEEELLSRSRAGLKEVEADNNGSVFVSCGNLVAVSSNSALPSI